MRPVLKRRVTHAIHCPPAPVGVTEGTRADVNFLAGLLVDKFAWHLPLYRQHQRLEDAGITVSSPWLTQLTQRSVGLLEPIYDAQFTSIRASRVKAMDETPVRAGRTERDTMCAAYILAGVRRAQRGVLPVLPLARGGERVCRPLGRSDLKRGAADRRLRRLRQLCQEGRHRARSMLDTRAALLRRRLLGTLRGSVQPEHLDAYLDKFIFRFHRRTSSSRGAQFYRLLEQAALSPIR